jgi:formate dehydrogenase major subunit
MPAHYEPQESPVPNALYPRRRANPARQEYHREGNRYHPEPGAPGADVFPYVFTTFRVTEHHTAGGMSRWTPHLNELMPEMFLEVSPELAAERGLENGQWCHVVTARSAIEGRALVTERAKPLTLGGTVIHQIGVPWHWGANGLSTGDAANELLSVALDPNVHIMETKAATCDIRPGRRPRGPELVAFLADYRRRAGLES